MDTKVAKITRSWTSPVISSPTPPREPSLLRRSPPGAQSDVLLIVLLAFAGPRQESQCLRFEAGSPGWEASYTASSAIFSDCDGKPHRRR